MPDDFIKPGPPPPGWEYCYNCAGTGLCPECKGDPAVDCPLCKNQRRLCFVCYGSMGFRRAGKYRESHPEHKNSSLPYYYRLPPVPMTLENEAVSQLAKKFMEFYKAHPNPEKWPERIAALMHSFDRPGAGTLTFKLTVEPKLNQPAEKQFRAEFEFIGKEGQAKYLFSVGLLKDIVLSIQDSITRPGRITHNSIEKIWELFPEDISPGNLWYDGSFDFT